MEKNNNSKSAVVEDKGDFLKVKTYPKFSFCDLPTEDTTTVITKEKSKDIKKEIRILYTRVNIDSVYGKKSEKILPNEEYMANVDDFLQGIYEDRKGSEDNSYSLSFEDWRNMLALNRANILLHSGARSDANKELKLDSEKVSDDIVKLAQSNRLSEDEKAKILAALQG